MRQYLPPSCSATPVRILLLRGMIAVVAVLGLASTGRADAFVQRNGPATLELRAPGPGDRIALADVLSVVLTVEGEAPITVDAPLKMPAGSPWLLVRRSRPTREKIDDKHERWRIEYEFAPREPGKLSFQFPDVHVGPDTVHAWKERNFEVATTIKDAETAKMREITGVEQLPDRVENESFRWIWIAAGVIVVAIVASLIYFWQRKRMTRRLAAELALDELVRLEGMQPTIAGVESPRLIVLTTLVRRYLERSFALPALRRTTQEFLEVLQTTPALHDDEKRVLAKFFQTTDAVRYAGVAVGEHEFIEWANAIRALLQARLQPAVGVRRESTKRA